MQSDHRHPGCKVIRAALTEPRSTTSTSVLSGVRRSSGDPKFFLTAPGMVPPSDGLDAHNDAAHRSTRNQEDATRPWTQVCARSHVGTDARGAHRVMACRGTAGISTNP